MNLQRCAQNVSGILELKEEGRSRPVPGSYIVGTSRKQGALSIYQEIPVRMLMEHTFSMCSTEKFLGMSGILKR